MPSSSDSQELPEFRITDEMRLAAAGLVATSWVRSAEGAAATERIDQLYKGVGADNLAHLYLSLGSSDEGQLALNRIYDGDRMVELFEQREAMESALLNATFEANPDYLGVRVKEAQTAVGHPLMAFLSNKEAITEIVNQEITHLVDSVIADIQTARSALPDPDDPELSNYDKSIAVIVRAAQQAGEDEVRYSHPETGYYDTYQAMEYAKSGTATSYVDQAANRGGGWADRFA